MKSFKIGLLSKIIIAIFLGILFSWFMPESIARLFVTFNLFFSNFLGFVIPLIIIGLVVPGISDLGKGAGKLLAITAAIAYLSTIISGFFSFFTTKGFLPYLVDAGQGNSLEQSLDKVSLIPFFDIPMPPLMDITTALVFSFVLGLGLSITRGEGLKSLFDDFKGIVVLIINDFIIPLLPLYIFGIFLKIGIEGEVGVVLGMFFKIIILIFAMHVILLLSQYTITWIITGKNPFRALYNMLPAYMTALGTQSSAATIPVTLNQVKKNGVDEELAGFVVPLCATIHLAGSILKIVACAYAVMYMMGSSPGLDLFSGFIFMLGITMVAAPGVPGGAIMAAIGLLQSMLGFDQNQTALMIALYITMDSFGTACNVTGDGAIALIVNRFYLKFKRV